MQQTKKGRRTRAVFLILLWILLFATSLYLLEFLLTTFINNPQGQSMASTDWAGYVVTSDLGSPQGQVIGVNASWTVPTVGVSSADAFSSAWIGIGGQSDKTLIQAGTEHDSVNGGEFYSAWYELLPDQAVRIADMRISPGDVITTSISLVNSDTNKWAIQIYDVTNGQGFYQNFVYNSSRSSAEWIVERPTVNNQISTLANFGSITFTDSYVTTGDNVGKIGSFLYSQLIMTTHLNVQLTSVSPLSADGSNFTVHYLTSG